MGISFGLSPDFFEKDDTKSRKLLSGNKAVLADGAVGTYYGSLTGKDTAGCELADITEPEIIVSFTLLPYGCTRSGISSQALMNQIKENTLCTVELNCVTGAVQLYTSAVPFLTYIH